MKTIFIINPKAGQGKNIEMLINNIKKTSEKIGADAEVYQTKCVGDATVFVRDYCGKNGVARFIACGGDGTLGEVVNGIMDFPGAEVGVVPMGTGNDFCRNFNHCDGFFDIEAQLCGETDYCDAICYKSVINGKEKTGYCVNMFNIGFDCNVADMTAKMKKKPLISGSIAYLISIFAVLIKKKGANLSIEIDGKEKHTGPLLLTSIANGKYCGGGIQSNPLASVHNGKMNVNIVYNISRINFMSKFPYYMKGTHIKLKGIEDIINNTQCEKVVITPHCGKMRLCTDGEISDAGRTEFSIVNNAFKFVLPRKDAVLVEKLKVSI